MGESGLDLFEATITKFGSKKCRGAKIAGRLSEIEDESTEFKAKTTDQNLSDHIALNVKACSHVLNISRLF